MHEILSAVLLFYKLHNVSISLGMDNLNVPLIISVMVSLLTTQWVIFILCLIIGVLRYTATGSETDTDSCALNSLYQILQIEYIRISGASWGVIAIASLWNRLVF